MVSHNNMIQSNHFRKHWARRVKTWFQQPKQKLRRRQLRTAQAAAVSPRPVGLLRPVVRCPTNKYNLHTRLGRGFTLAELKSAKITVLDAKRLGVAVDYRRQNGSEASLKANAQRLAAYKSKLVVFPRTLKGRSKAKADKKVKPYTKKQALDVSSADQVSKAVQKVAQLPFHPITAPIKKTKVDASVNAYDTITKVRRVTHNKKFTVAKKGGAKK